MANVTGPDGPWEIDISGVPVLAMMPNAVDRSAVALSLRGDAVEVPSGARMIRTLPAQPTARREFEFVCATRDELAFLRAFFHARLARREGFWFPTWQWEFDVYGYEMPNAGSFYLWTQRFGYPESFFPLGAPYGHLLMTRGVTWRFHFIDAVVAEIAAGIDRVHMGSPGDGQSSPSGPPATLTAIQAVRDDSYRPLWLRYGRFDTDEFAIESLNAAEGTAIVTLALIETPAEIP